MIARIIFATLVMGGLGVVFGCLLAYAAGKFAIKVDPRITAIRAVLPGANCGGCGFPGCDGYAAACVASECPLNKCAAGGTCKDGRIELQGDHKKKVKAALEDMGFKTEVR